MPAGKAVQRWYPSKADFPDERQFNVVRQLTDMLYAAQDQIGSLHTQNASLSRQLEQHHRRLSSAETINGPSTTKICGLFVKAATPSNGQTLKYNSASGQIEWS